MKVSPFVKTYVVLAVAVGLGAYAYLVESKKAPPSDKPKEKVLTFDKKKALDLAKKLAANVRTASVATKRLAVRSYDLPLGRFLSEYVRDQRACWNDPETKTRLAAYRTGRGK